MNRRVVLVGALLAVVPLAAQIGTVRIRVTTPYGDDIPTATASLLGAGCQPIRTASASDAGEILLAGIPLGDSHFIVTAPGFGVVRVRATVRGSNKENVRATLNVAPIEDVPVEALYLEAVRMPYGQTLDLAPTKPGSTKRHWWQIFH